VTTDAGIAWKCSPSRTPPGWESGDLGARADWRFGTAPRDRRARAPPAVHPPAVLPTLLLAWLVLYPILLVVVDAAHGEALRAFAARGGEWRALWASLWISLASVALAALIGVPLAFLFEWFEFPGRKLLGSLIALPAVLPPFVGVIAFLFLYGESGFAARFLQFVFRFDAAPWHPRVQARFCSCTRTRCTCTSTCSPGRGSPDSTPRCSKRRRRSAPTAAAPCSG
jgi:hypothetical protein